MSSRISKSTCVRKARAANQTNSPTPTELRRSAIASYMSPLVEDGLRNIFSGAIRFYADRMRGATVNDVVEVYLDVAQKALRRQRRAFRTGGAS